MNNIIKLNRYHNKILPELNKCNIPDLIKRIYANRGILFNYEVDLNINDIYNFNLFKNINKAVDIIIKNIDKKIVIVGDFDTDGVTSVALSITALNSMGITNVSYIIPNRFKHEHGLSEKLVNDICNINGELIITVDNGISSYEGVDLAKKNNIKVIITDHHIPTLKLPNADAIVNPNLKDCLFPSKCISGVGVIFYVMKALCEKLYILNWFDKLNINKPNLNDLLDLVAIGTIADMSYLDLNNRILVKNGIDIIKKSKCRIGIIYLIKKLNLNIEEFSSLDISFFIAPCINAAGRLKDMSISIKLLLTENYIEAIKLSKELYELNLLRKKITKSMELETFSLCNKKFDSNKDIYSLVLFNENWNIGLLGILASKLKDKFQKPTIIFSKINNKLLGSGRSIDNINIYEILEEINNINSELIIKFGGHSLAVGLTIEEDKLELFKHEFEKIIKQKLKNTVNDKVIWSDGELLKKDITILNAKIINSNGPWGNGFNSPIFDGKFNLLNKFFFKNNLKILISLENENLIIEGLVFDIDFNFWKNLKSKKLILAYTLFINKYSSNIQLIIKYVWPI